MTHPSSGVTMISVQRVTSVLSLVNHDVLWVEVLRVKENELTIRAAALLSILSWQHLLTTASLHGGLLLNYPGKHF